MDVQQAPQGGSSGDVNPHAYQGPGTSHPGSSHRGAPPTHQGGADIPDYRQMLDAIERSQGTAQQLEGQFRDLDSRYQQQSQVLERVRQAFTGEGEGEGGGDPIDGQIAQLQAEMDHYLAAGLDHEKRGQPIPLTLNLAIRTFQGEIQRLQNERAYKSEIAAMKAQLQKLSNPENIADAQAYQSIDGHIINALDTIYGQGDDYSEVKRHQFQAIARQISGEIRDLRQNEPHLWDVIRRDPRRQAKMVKHFVEQTIPPRARQILEQDHIQKSPISVDELFQAFREAGEIEDPKERSQIRSQIRQEILSRHTERMGGGRQGGGNVSGLF